MCAHQCSSNGDAAGAHNSLRSRVCGGNACVCHVRQGARLHSQGFEPHSKSKLAVCTRSIHDMPRTATCIQGISPIWPPSRTSHRFVELCRESNGGIAASQNPKTRCQERPRKFSTEPCRQHNVCASVHVTNVVEYTFLCTCPRFFKAESYVVRVHVRKLRNRGTHPL